jgi:Flp pilus assembly pilin Flp
MLLRLYVFVMSSRLRRDDGQTVAEYALVLLVVSAIAVAFLLWAKQSGKLDQFFDSIFAKLLSSVDPQATPTPAP